MDKENIWYIWFCFSFEGIYKKRLGEEENLTCLGNRDIFAVSWFHFPIWPPFWISPLFWVNNLITVIIFSKIHYKHHTCIIYKASNAFIAHNILLSFNFLLLTSLVFHGFHFGSAGRYIYLMECIAFRQVTSSIWTINYTTMVLATHIYFCAMIHTGFYRC